MPGFSGRSAAATRLTASPERSARPVMSRGGADERVPVPDSIHLFSTAARHPQHEHRAPLAIKVFPAASRKMRTGAPAWHSVYLDTLTRWIKVWLGITPDT
jgi:hypothetical protein